MAYKFIELDNGHRYRLVKTGLLWNSKYCVYLDPDSVGRMDIHVEYKGRNFESRYKSSSEADNLAGILKKMGIKKEDLLKVKLPEHTIPKICTEWDNILTWILTSRNW